MTKSIENRSGGAGVEVVVVNTALCFYAALANTNMPSFTMAVSLALTYYWGHTGRCRIVSVAAGLIMPAGFAAVIYQKPNKIPDPIGAFRSPETSSLLPYLPDRKFWYLGSQREGSYVIWDRAYFKNSRLQPDKVVSRVKNIACESDCPPVWVLLSKPLKNPELHGYQLEFTTAEAKDSPAWKHRNFERYYLYRPLQPASL